MSTKRKAPKTGENSNEVRLAGTLSGDPEVRVLPSGDELYVMRLVVPRTRRRPRPDGGRGPSVDVLDCCAWDARPRRSIANWASGDEVEVRGALRRRFYRVKGAVMSRVEVEVSSGRLIRRAPSG